MRNAIRIALFIVALVIGYLAPGNNVTAQTIYSAFNDFSGISDPTPNGVWSYGYSTTLGGPLVLYTNTALHGNYDSRLTQWTDGGRIDPNVIKNETGQDITLPLSGFFIIPATDYLYLHPSPEGDYSTVRWTAPASGSFDLAVEFRAPINTCPTTADVHVLHNGVSLFDALVEQSGGLSDQEPRTFTTVLKVVAGDTIDFTVGVGSNGTYDCDRTLLKATISQTAADSEVDPQPPCNEWNLARDFRTYPGQENPNRDSCGNLDIWHFLQGDENTYPMRIPSTYHQLMNFRSELGFLPGLNAWEGTTGPDPSFSGQPWIGVNNTGSTYYAPDGIVWSLGASAVHPSGNPFPARPAIVGWQSPVSGFVSVTGGVSDFDAGGPEDGILWFIDHYDGTNNTSLASGSIAAGGSQDFSQGIEENTLTSVEVQQGEYLYFIVDAGTYLWDDTTGLDITIRFLPELSLRITTDSPLPSGTVGVPYSTILAATGGTPPYTWAVASGALPTGLDLNGETGEIYGTPTTAGTFGFTIQVTDSSANTASKPFAVDGPPPSGTAGSDYTVPVNIDPDAGSGGSGGGGGEASTCSNYTVVDGDLPAGLDLDATTGEIMGTPTDGGTYNFTIGCTFSSGDNDVQTATKEFTITINNPLPTLTSLTPDVATAGDGDLTLTLHGTNFVESSVVHWNGADRATTYVSPTQLQAVIPASDLAAAGAASVTVFNPDPVGGESNTLPFTINPPNQPPTVQAGGPYTVDEGGAVTLTANGSDPDPGDTLTYAWDLDNNGSYETPGQSVTFSAAGLDGPSSQPVAVQVTDAGGLSATDATTVEVQNVAPTVDAGDDQTVYRNQGVNVSGKWADPAGALDNPYTWSWDLDGDGVDDESGSANVGDVINRSTSFVVDGIAILLFTVADKDDGSTTDVVQITVVNRAPVANSQELSTDEDTTLALTLNSTDADGDALSYSLPTQPDHGTLEGALPALVYTPDADFNGDDTFTFKANDGLADSNMATVNITVNPINDPPVALHDTVTTDEDMPVTGNVQANDSAGPSNEDQALTTTAVTDPAHGTASINADGSVTYTPDADFNGSDSFEYTVCDSEGACATASVTVLVAMVNDPPVASDDSVSTPEDTAVTINVAANDNDVDGNLDPTSVAALTSPGHGELVNNRNGEFGYTPSPNYFGPDSISYQICDSEGVCDDATVTISVTSVNDDPNCTDAAPSVSTLWPPDHQFESVTINGVSDIEDNPITIAITSIFQDEPVDASGADGASPDGQGIGTATAQVRAERDGSGNGRVYHIGFIGEDGQGGSCSGEVHIGVPKSQGKNGNPIDDGALYNSTASQP